MPVILLRFLPVEITPKSRPRRCPVCGSSLLQGWGHDLRRVQDAGELPATVGRYRCNECGHTFRHYPLGLDRASHSVRVRRLGAVAWALGLSYREVATILKERGVEMSHTTIWREGQALLRQLAAGPDGPPVRYAIDRHFVRHASPRLGVVIAADFGDGRPQVFGTIDTGNAQEVIAWLNTLVRDSGLEAKLLKTGTLDGR